MHCPSDLAEYVAPLSECSQSSQSALYTHALFVIGNVQLLELVGFQKSRQIIAEFKIGCRFVLEI